MSNYDEDLNENPFLQCQLSHLTSVAEIVVLLVPQRKSLPSNIDLLDIKGHIVVETRTNEEEEITLQTQNGEKVVIEDSLVKVNDLQVPILFSETHYGQDWEKVKILCIQRPLTEASFEFQDFPDADNGEPSPTSNKWQSGGNGGNDVSLLILDIQNAMKVLEKNCTDSDKAYIGKRLEMASSEALQTLRSGNKQDLQSVVKQYFELCLKRIKNHCKKLKMNEEIITACEVYFYNVAYGDLFPIVCAKNRDLDAQVNQRILMAYHENMPNKSLSSELKATLPASKATLTLLQYLSSPGAKLDALERLIQLPSLECKTPISSDELLPWLIQAIIHCQIFNLYSHLDFMTNFNLIGKTLAQQDLFNLATFEAALEHLRQIPTNPYTSSDLWSTTNEDLNKLFQAVFNSTEDTQQVQTCLELQFCHPLCDCDKCDRKHGLLSTKDDLRFWTPLSLASFLGKPMVVEHFLSLRNVQKIIEEPDKFGRTALHQAAFHGHQNALLLLINAKADVNAKDNLGNTALHYSAGFGHLSCTKALLYTAEHQDIPLDISMQNLKGDTPLHLASKHGFEKITRLLLEYGALNNVKNHHGEEPFDVAHDIVIRNVLK